MNFSGQKMISSSEFKYSKQVGKSLKLSNENDYSSNRKMKSKRNAKESIIMVKSPLIIDSDDQTEQNMSYNNSKPISPKSLEKYEHRYSFNIEKFVIKDEKSKLYHLKSLKQRINRKKRQFLLQEYPLLCRIAKCKAKAEMISIFKRLNKKWKFLIKQYMEQCFITHLYIRQIKNFSELMKHRQHIYEALDDPDILNFKVSFGNNLVKNFCKGLANFIIIFYNDLVNADLLRKAKASRGNDLFSNSCLHN